MNERVPGWYDEALYTRWHDKGYAQRFRVDRVIFQDKSEHQDVLVFETPLYGRVLAIDGIIQTTEKDEFAYHEMMTHVPIFAHEAAGGAVKKVLIIGGGDGGILREVLKHPGVELCHMVDIDDMVVEISKKYLPTLSDGACGSMSARETAMKDCTGKGYKPGSADYLNCQEQVIREMQFKEAFQRAGNPVPATSPPPTMAPLFRF